MLHKRAADLTTLLLPYTPDAMLAELARAMRAEDLGIGQIHLFPLGGIQACADWAAAHAAAPRPDADVEPALRSR